MDCRSKSRNRKRAARGACYYEPRLVLLENRLPLGDTVLSALLGGWLFGTSASVLHSTASSAQRDASEIVIFDESIAGMAAVANKAPFRRESIATVPGLHEEMDHVRNAFADSDTPFSFDQSRPKVQGASSIGATQETRFSTSEMARCVSPNADFPVQHTAAQTLPEATSARYDLWQQSGIGQHSSISTPPSEATASSQEGLSQGAKDHAPSVPKGQGIGKDTEKAQPSKQQGGAERSQLSQAVSSKALEQTNPENSHGPNGPAPVPQQYDYTIIAKTGDSVSAGQTISTISPDVSINDAGQVAMTGNLSSGSTNLGAALLIGNGTVEGGNRRITNIGFPPSASRDYAFPQINDSNQVIARDRVSGAPPATFIRSWDGNIPGLQTTFVQSGDRAPDPLGRYDSVTLGTRAPDSGVGFIGLTGGSVNTSLFNRPPTGQPITVVTSLTGGGFRPLAANGGRFVVRNGSNTNGSILLNNTIIASTSSGLWNSVGAAPGISADGRIVTFYGDLTQTGATTINQAQPTQTPLLPGRGIFVSVDIGSQRVIARVAGVGEFFSDFMPDDRVAVNSTLTALNPATVAFSAKAPDQNPGVYTSQISVNRANRVIAAATPSTVVKVGDMIGSPGQAVTALSIGYSPLNNVAQVAFQATVSSNDRLLIRAKPFHNPVLIIPGIGGTYALDVRHDATWLLNRGIAPPLTQIDPLAHVYDDLILTFTRAGYILDQDLFVVNYDWRLPVAPPFDGTYDGHIDGIDGRSISGTDGMTSPFQYSTQYLGYYLKLAAARWAILHPDLPPLDKVDVIGHSTGGLLARTYIESDAYGGVYDDDGHTLPTIDQFVMIGVPNRGASKAWNFLHDDWSIDLASGLVLRRIVNRPYQKLLAGRGDVTIGGYQPITLDSIRGDDGQPSPVKFVRQYIGAAKDLLATYEFGAFDPELRNDLLLDLNDGLDGPGSVGDPNGFADRAHVTDIYGPSLSTPTTVTLHQGGPFFVQSFTEVPPGHLVGSKEPWYSDEFEQSNGFLVGGDHTVPLVSSLGQFLNDSRVTPIAIGDNDHLSIVSDIETQRRILRILGASLPDSQISTDRYAVTLPLIGRLAVPSLRNVFRIAFQSDPVRAALLVDEQGRRLGFTPDTGPLAEIPNSVWLGEADGLGLSFGPVAPLQLQLTGQGSNYYVKVEAAQDGQFGGTILSGFLGDGEQVSSPITLSTPPDYAPPTANDDAFMTTRDTPAELNVLANDTRGSSVIDPSSVAIGRTAQHGETRVEGSGLINYRPNNGFVGTDTFTYTVKDYYGAASNAATVTVTVTPGADAVRWISHTSGSFLNGSNWSTGQVPGPGDDVVIDVPEDITVTYNAGYPTVTTIRSLFSNNKLEIRNPDVPSAVFTVLTTAVVNNNFDLSIQVFEAREGLTVNGPLTWLSGRFVGDLDSNIISRGRVRLNGPTTVTGVYGGSLIGGGTLENNSTVTIVGAGVGMRSDFTWNNLPGSILSIESSGGVGGGTFNNTGTVRKRINAQTSLLASVLHNTGSVVVEFGGLSLAAVSDGGGNFVVQSGAALEFAGATQFLPRDATVSGAGDVRFSGGSTLVYGNYTIIGMTSVLGGTVNFTHDVTLQSLTQTRGVLTGLGTITVPGSWTWIDGTIRGPGRIVANGDVTINGSQFSTLTLDNRTFDITRGVTWTGVGTLTTINGAVWNNLAGATFDARSDAFFYASSAVFHNAGTLRKRASINTSTFLVGLDNTGMVDVQTGTLRLAGVGNTGGSFLVEDGATLDFTIDSSSPGSFTLNQSAQVTGPGNVSFGGSTVHIAGIYGISGTTIINGGTADFTQDISLAALTLSAGSLTGPGTVTVTGALSWTGGTMSGPGRTVSAATGSLTISGGGAKTLDSRTLDNAGSAVWTGPGTLNSIYDAIWNNLAGATFEVRNDVSFDASYIGPRFNNAGTFRKLASAGTTRMSLPLYNTGTVQLQTGTLSLVRPGDSSGMFSVALGAALEFANGGNDRSTLSSASSVTGAGEVRFSNGTVFVLGSYSITGLTNIAGGTPAFATGASTGTISLSAGGLQAFGDMTVTGRFDWIGGTLFGPGRLLAGGLTAISTTGQKTLDGITINSSGATWSGSDISFTNGAVWNNPAGKLFEARGDMTISADSTSTFNNAGTFRKSLGTNQTYVGVALNNQGTIDVLTGTLVLIAGRSTGAFTVASGAVVGFGTYSNTSYVLSTGTVISGAGFATVLTTAHVNIAGMVQADNFQLNDGSADIRGPGSLRITTAFNWTAGSLLGAGSLGIASTATLTISGAAAKYLQQRTINNSGMTVWMGGDINAGQGAVFNNLSGSTFDARGDLNFASDGSAVFNNAATFRKSQGTNQTVVRMAFNNQGTVDVPTGTVALAGGGRSTSAFTVASGALISFGAVGSNSTYVLSTGTTISGAGFATVVAGPGSAANLIIDATVQATNFQLNDANATIRGAGSLRISGAFNWMSGQLAEAGSLDIAVGATLNMSGTGSKSLAQRTINNSGTMNWSGMGDITASQSAVLNNLTGATFNITNNQSFADSGCSSVFNNAGTVVKSGGSQTTIGLRFHNTGTVTIQSGTINFSCGTFAPSGGSGHGSPAVAAKLAGPNAAANIVFDTADSLRAPVSVVAHLDWVALSTTETRISPGAAFPGGVEAPNSTTLDSRDRRSIQYDTVRAGEEHARAEKSDPLRHQRSADVFFQLLAESESGDELAWPWCKDG